MGGRGGAYKEDEEKGEMWPGRERDREGERQGGRETGRKVIQNNHVRHGSAVS